MATNSATKKSGTQNSQKTEADSKQFASSGSRQDAGNKASGKDAASHTKAGEDKGAGGGKKQARKH